MLRHLSLIGRIADISPMIYGVLVACIFNCLLSLILPNNYESIVIFFNFLFFIILFCFFKLLTGIRVERSRTNISDTDQIIVFDVLFMLRRDHSYRILATRDAYREYWQSAIYLSSRRTLFPAHQFFWITHLVHNYRNAQILILGGGGCSLPEDILNNSDAKFVHVVEPEPIMIEQARKYFISKSNIEIFNTRAEIFVQVSKQKYEIIFLDFFSGPSDELNFFNEENFWQHTINLFQDLSTAFLMVNMNSPISLYREGIIQVIKRYFGCVLIVYPEEVSNSMLISTNVIDHLAFLECVAASKFKCQYSLVPA